MGTIHRHHYVPQFYLRGFADPASPGSVWVFGKEKPATFRVSINKIAFENDYYAFLNHAGERDTDSFERAASQVEGLAAEIIAKLVAGGRLEGKDRHRLAFFMGLTFTRVPAFRARAEEWFRRKMQAKVDEMCEPAALAETKRICEEITGEAFGMTAEEWSQAAIPIVEVQPELSLKLMRLSVKMSELLFKMTWDFVVAPKGHVFITSDNPILFAASNPDGRALRWVGLDHPECNVSFPISPGLALISSWSRKSLGRFEGRAHTVRTINRRTVIAAHRHVFASSPDPGVEKLVRRYATEMPAFERE